MIEDLNGGGQPEVEAAVIRALERKPEIAVPLGFAAQIAQSLPEKSASRVQVRPVFGQTAGYLAVAAMTAVLIFLTWTRLESLQAGRGFLFAIELLLVAQMLAVGFWLGIKSDEPA